MGGFVDMFYVIILVLTFKVYSVMGICQIQIMISVIEFYLLYDFYEFNIIFKTMFVFHI